MNNGSILLSTTYLGPIDYYRCLSGAKTAVIERYCNYIKQTYRNRCIIASANGPQSLSIPIERMPEAKCLTKDIRISEHDNWRRLHWNAIVSAYNSTPFFEYYEDDFRPFYEQKFDFLFDFNEALRELACRLLDIQPEVSYSTSYTSPYYIPADSNEQIQVSDLREAIHPKKAPVHPDFKPYYQVFSGKYGFQSNLSIIDLLFNMGPESIFFL